MQDCAMGGRNFESHIHFCDRPHLLWIEARQFVVHLSGFQTVRSLEYLSEVNCSYKMQLYYSCQQSYTQTQYIPTQNSMPQFPAFNCLTRAASSREQCCHHGDCLLLPTSLRQYIRASGCITLHTHQHSDVKCILFIRHLRRQLWK